MNTTPLAAFAAALALSACATPAAPPPPMVDLNVGIAKTCEASNVDLASGPATATIRMSNDGWCAVRVAEADRQPFLLGLVRARPENGRVFIQKIGGQTRIEYTPNPGYAGNDSFTVDLRSRTAGTPDAKVQVAVAVLPGAGAPVAAPAVPPPPIAATPAATAPRTPAARPKPATRAPARRP